jgi:hypothetical protein
LNALPTIAELKCRDDFISVGARSKSSRATTQWHGADYRYFKVKGDDGNFYILRFDEARSEWDLTMFQSPKAHMPQRISGCKIIPFTS